MTSGLRTALSSTGRAGIRAAGVSEPAAVLSANTAICAAPRNVGGSIPRMEIVLPLTFTPRERPGPNAMYRDLPVLARRGAKPRIVHTASASAALAASLESLCVAKNRL